MKRIKELIFKNPKTSLAGIIVALVGVARSLEVITNEVAAAILTIAASLGLLVAKDGDTPTT